MLKHLDIRGLAIIGELSVELGAGFQVITGETGTGKSILIRALSLLQGGKASADSVREGEDAAVIAGAFEVARGHPAVAALERLGIPADSEGELATVLVRRLVSPSGRSKAWVNDVPVTVSVLRELGHVLIDVFAQGESHRLLEPARHTDWLDRFLASAKPRDDVGRHATRCREIVRGIEEVLAAFRERRRDADYLAYRADDLDAFDPSREDYERVVEVCESAGATRRLRETLAEAQARLEQGASGQPLSQPLWEVARLLERAPDGSGALGEIASEASDTASRLDDLSFRVSSAIAAGDLDDGAFEASQERLAGYQERFRRFAVPDIDGLLAERERLRAGLEFLDAAAMEVRDRVADLADATAALEKAARSLTRARRRASEAIRERVEGELHELAMPGAKLETELVPVARALPEIDLGVLGDEETAALYAELAPVLARLGESGAESARFLLAANAGEPARPLDRVASGGETSRIVLALERTLLAGADSCVLVFDEIDTGVSGRVADVVGRKLRDLARGFQVICISHLAQVAAYADEHFLVEKHRRGRRTEVALRRLEERESEEAIARLLSGREVSRSSLANARSLLRKARETVA